jgi:hypothetical protein
MSLKLNNPGTKPSGLEVKTYSIKSLPVRFGEYEISMEDFLCAAEYVLTNSDLYGNDPRRQFIKCVQAMKEVPGYNTTRKRLASDVLPVPQKKTRRAKSS